MDRQIVYPGAIPLETDILNGERNAVVAIGSLGSTLFGSTTTANGLVCTPTSPASMRVQVGPGEIYARGNIDDTPFSSLPADTAHQVVKQGISLDTVLLNCPAPTTSGQSIVYLVQAAFQEIDTDPVTLPYYNSSDPTQAYSGPANSGVAQPTARRGTVVVSLKPGVAAATGSQTTPSVDSGYIALWTVTVTAGASSISSGNIAPVAGASLVPTGGIVTALRALPGIVQSGSLIYGVASGSANALTVSLNPAPASLQAGFEINLKAASTNTGPATLSVNGSGAAALTYQGNPLASGMLRANQVYNLVFDGSAWQVMNPNLTGIFAYDGRIDAGSDTVTVPAWATHAEVDVVGGGGGGGGSGSNYSGGGGGAGGYATGYITVTPGAVLNRVVGAGGAGGFGDGASGGTSSLDGFASATGGGGGHGGNVTAAGGEGGSTSGTAPRNFRGGTGGDGDANNQAIPGGAGASGPFGGGSRTGAGGGTPGVAPGSGGGGAWQSNGSGASGADGAVLIRWIA